MGEVAPDALEADGDGLGVFGAEGALGAFEGVGEGGVGLVVAHEVDEDGAEVALGVDGGRVVGAEGLSLEIEGAGEVVGGAVQLAEVPVGVAEEHVDRLPDPWPLGESGVDLRGGDAEDLAEGGVDSEVGGGDGGEGLLHEEVDIAGLGERVLGQVALSGGLEAVAVHGEQRGGGAECGGAGADGGDAVAEESFADGVPGAVAFGLDGLAGEVAAEVLAHGRGALVAAVGVFVEALEEDGLELVVEVGSEGAWAAGRGAGDVLEGGAHAAADLVGHLAGEELVEHDAEGVDIGSDIDVSGASLGLLGAGPGERADEVAAGAEGERGVSRGPGESEVEDPGVAVGVDADVAGLEVPVDDAAEVGVSDGVADIGEEGDGAGDGWVFAEVIVDGVSLDELHDEVGPPVVGGAAVVDADDVGVSE